MGQSKGSDYNREPTKTAGQITSLDQILAQALPGLQQAMQGYAQFLPGGGGGEAITAQANKNFQQQTLPNIMNAFGSGSKSSSALNQALAAGASNLNTDLAAQQAQLQLQAAQGAGNLAGNAAQLGTQDQFALAPKKTPFWQDAFLAAIGAGGNIAGAMIPGVGAARAVAGGAANAAGAGRQAPQMYQSQPLPTWQQFSGYRQ